jgi:hypothetical protein
LRYAEAFCTTEQIDEVDVEQYLAPEESGELTAPLT